MARRWSWLGLCLFFSFVPTELAARAPANSISDTDSDLVVDSAEGATVNAARAPSEEEVVPLASYMKDAGKIKGVHVLYSFPGNSFPPHYKQPADVPPNASQPAATGSAAKGTFVMLHACGHHARNFYDLPEEVEMTIAVLQRGFAVFAPQAYPLPGGCWGPSHDGILVKDALQIWLDEHGMADKPLYGLGVSNGGVLLSYLYSVMGIDFKGMHFNVSPGGAVHGSAGTFTQRHPPVAFVRMLADPYAPAPLIDKAADALRATDSPVAVYDSPPQPLGYLYRRAEKIPLSRPTMALIIQRINEWGYAEEREGPDYAEMKNLPPTYQKYLQVGMGRMVVKRVMQDGDLADACHVHLLALSEELMVVEGHHAPTSLHVGESLDFILNDYANFVLKDRNKSHPPSHRLLLNKNAAKQLQSGRRADF